MPPAKSRGVAGGYTTGGPTPGLIPTARRFCHDLADLMEPTCSRLTPLPPGNAAAAWLAADSREWVGAFCHEIVDTVVEIWRRASPAADLAFDSAESTSIACRFLGRSAGDINNT